MNYDGKDYGHEFEPHEYVILVQDTKIVTRENKAIHSVFFFRKGKSVLPYSLFFGMFPI